jgi:DNA-directed RNA polymerase II subunit RPB2
MEIKGDEARSVSERLLKMYFSTQAYPYTRHHIESYDQFLSQDLPALIQSQNPILILEDFLTETLDIESGKKESHYRYRAEINIGGEKGDRLYIGTPTLSLQDSKEIRLMFPNEARLRNLTYAAMVEADITIKLTISSLKTSGRGVDKTVIMMDSTADSLNFGYLARFPLMRIPIMLHSRYCILHGKPQALIKEAGECMYDYGGYFIVDGAEKILITHQEQAFNTLYITPQARDPKTAIYSSISCLSPKTRQVKRVIFEWARRENVLRVGFPMVRKTIPIFVAFRALGIQSDEDILRLILPDPESAEAKILEPHLHESMLEAHPFLDKYSAIQYIKTMTKGFSEAHVLDILYNQSFIHVENRPMARASFLAECVRKILRVKVGIDTKTDRDDIRNQRCLTSGILIRMLFQGIYSKWVKAMTLTIDKEYKYNKSIYRDASFQNLFAQGTLNQFFKAGMLTEGIMRGFKGKWGDSAGVLQALSRLSYMDFLSHCRRVVLDFDTGMKLPGPRRLHTSQYGYFCTSETPCGASIGITKNLSTMTSISTATDPAPFIQWLLTRGNILSCDQVTPETLKFAVPVFVNEGIIGYTMRPTVLRDVLKLLKWNGCLPAATSMGFSIRDRRIFVFLDEGRPLRPLIHLGPGGRIPLETIRAAKSWRDLVMGRYPTTLNRSVYQSGFMDPLATESAPDLDSYVAALAPTAGVIEYVDPYEANESYVANFPEHIKAETSHLEIHPSTITGLMTSMIPYANHNQSPRNQLSCSQSKQGVSIYTTNFMNRFDNQAHVFCYPQAPIVRTLYYDYLSDGAMAYGHNLILAMGSFTGYNQDDGIIMNADSFERGMFRSTSYRTYELAEEDDQKSQTKTRIGNPAQIPGWTSLRIGVDYSKLDDRGIIKVGEMVDETTVLVGAYIQTQGGEMKDASVTAQVWTRGRVEKVVAMVNNGGLALVKVRIVQERVPELGDKFSNRHGQKGTIGMFIRAHDMPRTKDGIPVDMIMNPHAIPSRMTVAQLLEALVGKAAAGMGAIANATMFMNEGDPSSQIGAVLRDTLGMEPMGEEIMYDGMSGQMIPSQVFIGNVYTMRLKHMTEDKWNARGAGRREQRTHQPTGGRGNQGGLRIGEMECWALQGHGVSGFFQESLMKRADEYETWICNGCGTQPIYNEAEELFICPTCDGPVKYVGSTANTLEIMPPNKRSAATFSKVQIPYAMKLLNQEFNTYMNIGMRFLTAKDMEVFRHPPYEEMTAERRDALLSAALPERVLPETEVPEMLEQKEDALASVDDLTAMGVVPEGEEEQEEAPGAAIVAPMAQPTTSFNIGPVAGVTNGMNITMNAAQPQNKQQDGLEEVDLDELPLANAPQANAAQANAPQANALQANAPQANAPQANVQPGTINVQTNNQPVMVIPMNVAPPPAEVIAPPAPGAPSTIAVDTSNAARAAQGLPAVAPRNATRNANAPRNNGTRRVGFNVPANAGTGAVSVNKLGSSDNGPAPAANVRVNVMKQGQA